jgi:hypothetical protein
MGKNAKEHRKKVAKRNAEIKAKVKKFEKSRQDQLMELIQKEKAAGAFNIPQKDILPTPTLTETKGPII